MKSRPSQPGAISIWVLALLRSVLVLSAPACGQGSPDGGSSPASGSINTPRPINPAAGTTNPSARATQTLNPYLGSTARGVLTKETLQLSLEDAIARGLQYNVGPIDSRQASANARAQREEALSALLPQISA
jgi:hypothetical protein